MAAANQYELEIIQSSTTYDQFDYQATILPEYERNGMELARSGRYHVVLLWPLGTVHFMVYKNGEQWDVDDVEEDAEEDSYSGEAGAVDAKQDQHSLSLEAIIPDVVIEQIGSRIDAAQKSIG